MSEDIEIMAKLEELRADYGKWTAHNIHVRDGVYTISKEVNADQKKLARLLQVVSDSVRKPLSELRVLDLACLEGMYAIEFARHGAQVLAIEGREAHIVKARAVADLLDLDNVQFIQGDVRDISIEKSGTFDVILCLGILYHINAPDVFEFMGNIGEMCSDLAIIDTHVALKAKIQEQFRNRVYCGLNYYEYSKNLDKDRVKGAVWASLNNPDSFWPIKSALLNLIQHSGFTSATEIMSPYAPKGGRDRVVFLAKKGVPIGPKSAPGVPFNPPVEWPDQDPNYCHPYQNSMNVFVRRCIDIIPQSLKNVFKKLLGR